MRNEAIRTWQLERYLLDELLLTIAARTDLDAPLLLDRLFRRHPESTRTMAVLHHLDGMTLAEVARECGMSVSGVRKRLRGLRASLAGLRTAAPAESEGE